MGINPELTTTPNSTVEGVSASRIELDFNDANYIRISGDIPQDLQNLAIQVHGDILPKYSLPWRKEYILATHPYRLVTDSIWISELSLRQFVDEMDFTVTFFFTPLEKNHEYCVHLSSVPEEELDMDNFKTNAMAEMCQFLDRNFPDAVHHKFSVTRTLVLSCYWNILGAISNESFKFGVVINSFNKIQIPLEYDALQAPNPSTSNPYRNRSQQHFDRFKLLRETHTCGEDKIQVAIVDSGINLSRFEPGRFPPTMKVVQRTGNECKLKELPCQDENITEHGTGVAFVLAKTCCTCVVFNIYQRLPDLSDIVALQLIWEDIVKQGIHIMNLSSAFGDDGSSLQLIHPDLKSEFTFTIKYYSKKYLHVNSAGNKGLPYPQFFADLPSVISVGSVDWDRKWSYFSSGKCRADVGTYGENLWLKFENCKDPMEVTVRGTSYAAPAVSGLASILICRSVSLKSVEIMRKHLQSGALIIPGCQNKHYQCRRYLQPKESYDLIGPPLDKSFLNADNTEDESEMDIVPEKLQNKLTCSLNSLPHTGTGKAFLIMQNASSNTVSVGWR